MQVLQAGILSAPGSERFRQSVALFPMDDPSDQQLGLLFQPGATIPHPSAVRATQQPQAGLIRLRELVAFVLLPGVKVQFCLQGHGLQQAGLPLPGGTGQGDQQLIGGFCRWRHTKPMQAGADLRFLELAEIGLGLIQTGLQQLRLAANLRLAGDSGPVEGQQAGMHCLFQHPGPLAAQLPHLHQFIQQALQPLQWSVQSSTPQGRCEVVQHHGMTPSLGLRSFAGIVDDEGVEVRDRSKGQLGAAGIAQPHRLARQPFRTAVLAHMQHHLGLMHAAQPEVLSQIPVRWRQIR